MNAIARIRSRLGLTQAAFGAEIGKAQGTVWLYEVRGMTVPPKTAMRLIEAATARGLALSLDHIYRDLPLPEAIAEAGAAGS